MRGPEKSEEGKAGSRFAAEMGEFRNDIILIGSFPKIITLPNHPFVPKESWCPGLL